MISQFKFLIYRFKPSASVALFLYRHLLVKTRPFPKKKKKPQNQKAVLVASGFFPQARLSVLPNPTEN